MNFFALSTAVYLSVACLSVTAAKVNYAKNDPCLTHSILDSEWRNVDRETNLSRTIDDSSLTEAWYKFSQCGSRIPEYCVKGSKCGSSFPIWMNGLHPTEKKPGPVDVQICSSLNNNFCCNWNTTIRVKFCNTGERTFFVYKLKTTDPLMSYCASKLTFCADDEYYDNERQRCMTIAKDLLLPPKLSDPFISHWKIIKFNGTDFNATRFSMECTAIVSSMEDLQAQADEVEFQFRAENVDLVKFSANTSNLKAQIEEDHLKRRYGEKIVCLVRLKLKSHSCQYNRPPHTKWLASQPFQHILKLQSLDSGEVHEAVTFEEELESKKLRLVSNFPMTAALCLYAPTICKTSFNIFLETPRFVDSTHCTISFTMNGGFYSEPFALTIIRFPAYDSWNHSTQVNFFIHSNSFEPFIFTKDLNIPYNLTAVFAPRRYCSSLGDIGISTFDGDYFKMQMLGDFYLLRDESSFQIQIRQVSLTNDGRNSYTCAVVVREYNEIIAISVCNNEKVPGFVKILNSNRYETPMISMKGNLYTISLLSEIVVSISARHTAQYSFLNVHVAPLNGIAYRGLCSTPGTERAHRVSEEGSLFGSDIECGRDSNEREECHCAFDHNVGLPNRNCALAIILKLNPEIKMCATGYICKDGYRIFAPSYDTLCDSLDTFYVKPSSIYSKVTLPPRGDTTRLLNETCLGFVLKSATYKTCYDVVGKVTIDAIVIKCAQDMVFANQEDVERSAISTFEEICLFEVLYTRVVPRNAINVRSGGICPNVCSQRGSCLSSQCQCNPGYAGNDCSVLVTSVPSIEKVVPSHCDATHGGRCSVINLYVKDVYNSVNLTCRLEPLGICDKLLGANKTIGGSYISNGYVKCDFSDLPVDSTLYLTKVSLSNDGVRFSPSMSYAVYNGKCIKCRNGAECPNPELANSNCLQKGTSCAKSESSRCLPVDCIKDNSGDGI